MTTRIFEVARNLIKTSHYTSLDSSVIVGVFLFTLGHYFGFSLWASKNVGQALLVPSPPPTRLRLRDSVSQLLVAVSSLLVSIITGPARAVSSTNSSPSPSLNCWLPSPPYSSRSSQICC